MRAGCVSHRQWEHICIVNVCSERLLNEILKIRPKAEVEMPL